MATIDKQTLSEHGAPENLVPVVRGTPLPVEKPSPERLSSITMEENLPGVKGERRSRRAATLKIYAGTLEVDNNIEECER